MYMYKISFLRLATNQNEIKADNKHNIGIEQLFSRYNKCLESHGDYVEK